MTKNNGIQAPRLQDGEDVKKPTADTVLDISQLELDPTNARQRTERSSYMIQESLQQFGPLRSLVGQRLPDGRLVVRAGNGTLEAAGQVGIDKVRVIERKDDELVLVVTDGLDESQWKQYAIADNRTSDLSDWNIETLMLTHAEEDLSQWFFDDEIAGWAEKLQDDGEGTDEVEPEDDAIIGDKYALAIVLTGAQAKVWRSLKDSEKHSKDKSLLLSRFPEVNF